METCHRAEIRGQGFALACLKLLDEVVNGLLDELLCWVVFLAGALLVRRLAAVLPCRILPVRPRPLLITVVQLLAAKAVLLIVVGMTLFLICCPLWGDLRA